MNTNDALAIREQLSKLKEEVGMVNIHARRGNSTELLDHAIKAKILTDKIAALTDNLDVLREGA